MAPDGTNPALNEILAKAGIDILSVKKMVPGKHPPYGSMLASLAEKPFNNSGWIFEIKWDGYRAIAEITSKANDQSVIATLYSRNGKNLNIQFPQITAALGKIKIEAVFDGEIVALEPDGRSSFTLLQEYLRSGSPASNRYPVVYYVFDILYLEGYELLNLPLLARKQILQAVIKMLDKENSKTGGPDLFSGLIKYCGHIGGDGKAFFEEAAKNNLEGIIAKKSDSAYMPGSRSKNWLKIKTRQRQEVIICGYTEPKGSRAGIGALITGVYYNGKLVFTGLVGTGFDSRELTYLYKLFTENITDKAPFSLPATGIKAHWVKPVLVAEVEFAEWTKDNLMRQPSYIGLRADKDAKDVVRENPVSTFSDSKEPAVLKTAHPQTMVLSNPLKVFWPEEGYTKLDLYQYYEKISGYILPYLVDRPHSLNRCPDGIGGECFYQKDIDYELPPGLITRRIFSESKNGYIDYFICNGIEALLYMVNLGCIDIHPWHSRVSNLENPDYAILDLDPLEVDFETVVKTAIEVKKVMDEFSIEGCCKTSGSKGLHIFIALEAKYSYEVALDFIKLLARLVNKRLPDITSLERSPEKRHNRVYLDCYQNRIGQTIAAPYCVRPRKGATVSAPIYWEELKKPFKPSDFTMQNIFKRLKKTGDIWQKVLGRGTDIENIIVSIGKQPF